MTFVAPEITAPSGASAICDTILPMAGGSDVAW